MVFFNYALRKLNAKIVYYGPGLCGKTTNLVWIHDHFEGGERGKMISLATEGDRTIFFDLLPLEIGAIRGMDVTLQLYTVPGQVHYNSTRQLVLRGADGVVFVADSQRAMQGSNIGQLQEPPGEPPAAGYFPRRVSPHSAVQQARPSRCGTRGGTERPAQPLLGAHLRGHRDRGGRRPGDPRGHRQAGDAESAPALRGRDHRLQNPGSGGFAGPNSRCAADSASGPD